MKLTSAEKEYLISHLEGELTWTTEMVKQAPFYQKKKEILESLLSKLDHPFKRLLDKNSKSTV